MIKQAAEIVKKNFVVATFDAMNFNYFSPMYENAEDLLNAAVDQKMSLMSDDDIQTFALAIVDGGRVEFDTAKEDFYVTF